MRLPRRSRTTWSLVWLLLVAAPVLWLGSLQLQRTIDPTNESMKAPGTPQAEATAALHRSFGQDHVMLLAFADRAGLPLQDLQRERLDRLRERLAGRDDVVAVDPLPAPADDIALFAARLAPAPEAAGEAAVALRDAAARSCPPTLSMHATGLPWFEAALANAVAGERAHMVPLITGVLLLLSWALFGRLRLAIALLLPALGAIACTGGLLQLLGRRLDPIAVLLEPVLMTVGVAGAVHFALAHERATARGHAASFAAAFAARSLRGPALLAVATTMVGFLVLAGNALPAVASFGVHAAFGTALANAFCFLLLPVVLPLCGTPRHHRGGAGAARWTAFLRRRGRAWVALAGVASLLAVLGLSRLHVDNDPLHLLAPDHPFRVDHRWLVDRLGGVDTFDLLVPAGSPAQTPTRLLPFVAAAVAQPAVAGLAGRPQRAPDGTVRLPLRVAPGGSDEREALFAGLARDADLLGLDGVRPAGGLVQMAIDSGALIRGQLQGLFATFACLFAFLAIGFRSLRTGLLALLPSVLPCLLLYGGIGLLGHRVSVATAMIGSVMLGLVVDNTIHFVHHFRRARRSLPAGPAVQRTLHVVGRPLWISCTVLATGFATAVCSSMESTVEFGTLASLGIAAALFANALVLPAALLLPAAAGGAR